ncbi:hypothetical protein FOL47_009317 [Perkinsus chesapeaki]|uniref:EF-hand domain-containing protein n=1 Tax=Perkinsus chesapeaki TaxID=330153 RepID=A0A7J6L934_PERCH|nr:hypothetical protein FOL47_009317 [Perkinsus chesapeaki]
MDKLPYERATLKHSTATSLVKPKAYVLIPALRKRLAADLAPKRLKFRVKVPNLSSLEFTFIGLRSLTDQEKVRELESYVKALKVHTICGLTIEFDARYTAHTFTSDKKKLCVSVTLHALNGNVLFNSGLLEAPPPRPTQSKTKLTADAGGARTEVRPMTAPVDGFGTRRMSASSLASTQAPARRNSTRRASCRRRVSTRESQRRQGLFVDSQTFLQCKESSEEREIREVAIENNLHFSQMEKIKRLFEKTDADGSGEIEQGEFDDMVRSLSKAKDA